MKPVAALDSITILAAAAALIFLATGWKRIKGPDIRLLLATLGLFTLFYAFCLWVEWTGISLALHKYGDYAGALTPMIWAFVFYAFIQREMIRDLRKSEENLRVTLDSIGDGVITADRQGRVTRLNPVAERLTGWSFAEALGRPVAEVFTVINSRTRAPVTDPVAKVLRAGEIVGLANHTALIRRDGQERQIADSGAPIKDRSGRVLGVVLVFRDVTDSYRMQESLRESEERYRSFVEHFKGIAYRGRMDFSVEFFHGAVEEITGYTEAEFVSGGLRWDSLIHPDDLKMLFTEKEARLHTTPGFSYEREYRIYRKDGQMRWVQDSIQNVCDETGRVACLQGTIYDITECKRDEASLLRARDELAKYAADLKSSNRKLEDFAYIASHDLKEPLRGIHNYSSFLLADYADRLDEAGKDKLQALVRLTRRLEFLLDDLLYYSRVSQIELAMQRTETGRLVREVLDTMEPLLEEQQVAVTIAGDMPTVVCDRTRVGEVFRNLISNAVKYNDNQVKQVEVGWRQGANPGSVVFYVRDNGIGIPEKHQEKVFKIFKRLHGRDQYGGGTGSGLTLASRIIERHGGTIGVTSEYGRGSTFWFTLSKGERDA